MRSLYNHQIDLLRAFAVFLVIFNHLDFKLFSGGFIGVDIFFVISGYLITKNLSKEYELYKAIHFKDFYRKRIRRLAPSFFLMIGGTALFYFLYLDLKEFEEFCISTLASITLTANVYYTYALGNYFSIDASYAPLLHIWSLSLEEQFYLFWPLTLLFIFNKNLNIKIIFIIFTFISLGISHYLSIYKPVTAYYLLPSRIFEFTIGAIIVFLPKIRIKEIWTIFILVTCILILLLSSYIINNTSLFPSYIALIPCITTATFIYFSSELRKKYLLSPIYYLGKISYPLYLWHWPIIVYFNINNLTLSIENSILIIILTILLAIFTYEIIEKKCYKIKNITQSLFIFPFLIVIFLLVSLYQIKTHLHEKLNKAPPSEDTLKCIGNYQYSNPECFLGNHHKPTIDFLLVGDSHANAQSGFINQIALDANLKGEEISFSSTIFLIDFKRASTKKDGSFEVHPDFQKRNNFIKEKIMMNNYKYIILAGYYPHNWIRNIYYQNNIDSSHSYANFISGMEKTIEYIISSGAKPIILNDNPILYKINTNCHLRQSEPKNICFFNQSIHEQDFHEWNSILKKLKNKYPQLKIIDFNDLICLDSKCYSYLNNTALYRDNQHLTYSGSKQIGIEYLKKYENPLIQ